MNTSRDTETVFIPCIILLLLTSQVAQDRHLCVRPSAEKKTFSLQLHAIQCITTTAVLARQQLLQKKKRPLVDVCFVLHLHAAKSELNMLSLERGINYTSPQ